VLTAARSTAVRTTVEGTLNSRPGQWFDLRFFANPTGNEGRFLIGQTSVRTNAAGNAAFTFAPAQRVAVGRRVTATATNQATGDTSELSAAATVTP
jgi:hypothetical protein